MTLILRILALAILVGTLASASPAQSSLPNIVVVLTDDQGAFGNHFTDWMPNVAAFPVDLVSFHHASNLCCPDRATFLTGLYPHHHKVEGNAMGKFNPTETIATNLHGLGYYTALSGKYLNRYGQSICGGAWCFTVNPGWDRWFAMAGAAGGGGADYYNYDMRSGTGENSPTTLTHYGTGAANYSTDVIADQALAFLRDAPTEQPVFLWFAPNAPHQPKTPAPRHATAPCATATYQPPDWNIVTPGQPSYLQSFQPMTVASSKHTAECRTLLAVDEAVGRIEDELAAQGRLDNTLILFLSDNGMHGGSKRLDAKFAPYATRVTARASWPARWGVTPRTITTPLSGADLAPTLCAIAGCSLGPYPTGQASPDGVNTLAALDGGTLARDLLYSELPKPQAGVPAWWAVRTTPDSPLGLWHYIEYGTGEKELYDLATDPWEMTNRTGQPAYAVIQAELAAQLAQIKAS